MVSSEYCLRERLLNRHTDTRCLMRKENRVKFFAKVGRALAELGFKHGDDSVARRRRCGVTDVVALNWLSPRTSAIIGCSPSSFVVGIACHPDYIPLKNGKRVDGDIFASLLNVSDCAFENALVSLPPHHLDAQPDIWAVERSGDDQEKLANAICSAMRGNGESWLHHFDSPDQVLKMLQRNDVLSALLGPVGSPVRRYMMACAHLAAGRPQEAAEHIQSIESMPNIAAIFRKELVALREMWPT